MTILNIIYALGGISIIIFIHELGHYLAAKKVGVRVERFAIGFDPPVRGRNLRFFSFRHGDTEYVLGMIPFGGYVKLAGGEMILDPGHKAAPDELPGKSIGARSLVFVAGSFMNIVSALGFFMIAFMLGVPFPEPSIGRVEPGTPAWDAGIRAGDTVLTMDGKEALDFDEVTIAVALGKTENPIRMTVSRRDPNGKETTRDLLVARRWNAEYGRNEIGVHPELSNVILEPEPKSQAAKLNLKAGDRIAGLELRGYRVPELPTTLLLDAWRTFIDTRPGEPYKMKLIRDGREEWVTFSPRPREGEPPRVILGVLASQGTVVRAIQPGSEALAILKPLDELREIDGKPVHGTSWLSILEGLPGKDNKLELKVTAPDGAERLVSIDRDAFLLWSFRGEVFWGAHPSVGEVKPDTPAARAGLAAGDIVTRLGEKPCFSAVEIAGALEGSDAAFFKVSVLRQGSRLPLENVERAALDGSGGITWRTMPRIANVTQGGPAERLGILPGSSIVSIAKKPVHSWPELQRAVGESSATSEVEVAWLTPEGVERSGSVLPASAVMEDPGIPVELLQKVVRVGALESIRVGARRTVLIAKQIFFTLRSLILREVSAKNLAGPIGITHLLTKVAETNDISKLLYWLALISVNLGLFNLLPFPILDGGHLLFLAIEKVKGSPVSARIQEWAMNIAFLAIICLAVFVTFNDLKRLLR